MKDIIIKNICILYKSNLISWYETRHDKKPVENVARSGSVLTEKSRGKKDVLLIVNLI